QSLRFASSVLWPCRLIVLPLSTSYPLFFFTGPPPPEIYTLSLHDALPISSPGCWCSRSSSCGRGGTAASRWCRCRCSGTATSPRSEEHTSELQSRFDLVCRLLLEKKKSYPRWSNRALEDMGVPRMQKRPRI